MLCVVRHLPILVGIQSGRQVWRGLLVPVITSRHIGDDVVDDGVVVVGGGSITSSSHSTPVALGCTLNVSHTSVHLFQFDSEFFAKALFQFLQRKKAVARVTSVKKPQLERQRCQVPTTAAAALL